MICNYLMERQLILYRLPTWVKYNIWENVLEFLILKISNMTIFIFNISRTPLVIILTPHSPTYDIKTFITNIENPGIFPAAFPLARHFAGGEIAEWRHLSSVTLSAFLFSLADKLDLLRTNSLG